eukprot:2842536-Lingulodinium_polyedra.AAC.1
MAVHALSASSICVFELCAFGSSRSSHCRLLTRARGACDVVAPVRRAGALRASAAFGLMAAR